MRDIKEPKNERTKRLIAVWDALPLKERHKASAIAKICGVAPQTVRVWFCKGNIGKESLETLEKSMRDCTLHIEENGMVAVFDTEGRQVDRFMTLEQATTAYPRNGGVVHSHNVGHHNPQ